MNKAFFLLKAISTAIVFGALQAHIALAQPAAEAVIDNEVSEAVAQPTLRPKTRDYIIAVVQSEPVTNAQLNAQILFLKQNYKDGNMPSDEQFEQTALQQLITFSALSQRAKEYGLKVDRQMVVQAISTVATNNGKTVSELRKDFESAAIPFSVLEQNIGQQILMRQLRERLLDPTIYVSNAEIDAYLAQTVRASNTSELLISIAHILIAVPDEATAAQEAKAKEKAIEVQKEASQIKSPQEFIDLVNRYSDDPNKAQTGGAFGAMPMSRYPDLFVDAVRGLKPGELTEPVRSGAGYHILLLIDREQSEMVVEQTHARHILLPVTETRSEEEAIQMLLSYKRQIEDKQVAFEILAKERSQDASANAGGDLGWVVSGMFVPEFESVMNRLKVGEISNPVTTRFGVHLIEVLERRQAELTPVQQRGVAREAVHQRKVMEAYDYWVQGITGETYIEMRDVSHD